MESDYLAFFESSGGIAANTGTFFRENGAREQAVLAEIRRLRGAGVTLRGIAAALNGGEPVGEGGYGRADTGRHG